jgi:hypothetical protein
MAGAHRRHRGMHLVPFAPADHQHPTGAPVQAVQLRPEVFASAGFAVGAERGGDAALVVRMPAQRLEGGVRSGMSLDFVVRAEAAAQILGERLPNRAIIVDDAEDREGRFARRFREPRSVGAAGHPRRDAVGCAVNRVVQRPVVVLGEQLRGELAA